jgi:hypothetical protein
MRKLVKVGKVYGNRKVLKFVSKLGPNPYFKVKCMVCGAEVLMHGDSIASLEGGCRYRKGQECRNCWERTKSPFRKYKSWKNESQTNS